MRASKGRKASGNVFMAVLLSTEFGGGQGGCTVGRIARPLAAVMAASQTGLYDMRRVRRQPGAGGQR
ncbi:hypothetical protein HYPGJ_31810 [Hyphomicrobium sp. GJ21]|nr:hypothetical protein HYPGJ_31810 [Hyphomicrobium sp. GJ21]